MPEARVELARRETTVFETAASAIPPLGHISLHSITEACKRVHEKIASRPALLFRTPQSARTPRAPHPERFALALPAPAWLPRSSNSLAASALRSSLSDPALFRESRDCGLFAGCALG